MATQTGRRRPKQRPRWRNWARNQECAPAAIEHPSAEEELVAAVRKAIDRGQRVKVAGSGHSFTAIALTDGRLISLENYGRVLSADREKLQITVQAGIRLSKLSPAPSPPPRTAPAATWAGWPRRLPACA